MIFVVAIAITVAVVVNGCGGGTITDRLHCYLGSPFSI